MRSQTDNITRPGENHTGIALHPEMAEEMLEGTQEFGPTSSGGAELLAQARVRAAKLSLPVATMPPSPNVAVERLPLLDKLGARLQFERTGVRLYDALISKYDAYGTFEGGPSREDLEHIRTEELRHFALAQGAIERLGGDPTVVTPCANLQSVASRGICDVLVDPRTTLVECLDAIMVAELADHESWEQLAGAMRLAGETELEAQVREAEKTEAEHLEKVRRWMTAAARNVNKAVH